jgi:hypothetical protein
LAKWLDAVQEGSATMSQRARSAIDKHGGLPAAISGVSIVEKSPQANLQNARRRSGFDRPG